MNRKTAILMSTYNGENYLQDQIDSIKAQDSDKWILYIRDDGSTDSTRSIIESNTLNDERIVWLDKNKNQNLGVTKSFIRMLKSVDEDFYMFCDQDDFWLPNKVRVTTDCMKDRDTIPTLVHTNLKVVDQNLNEINLNKYVSGGKYVKPYFPLLVMDNYITGCTLGFNRCLRDLVIRTQLEDCDFIIMHDWWVSLVAAFFGEIIFTNEITILYRQHGNNVVGALKKDSLQRRISLKLRNGLGSFRMNFKKAMLQLQLFRKIYTQESSDTNNEINVRIIDFLLFNRVNMSTYRKFFFLTRSRIRMTRISYTLQLYYILLFD